MHSPVFPRQMSSCTTHSSTGASWRWRDRRRGWNFPASAAANRRPRRAAFVNGWTSMPAPPGASVGLKGGAPFVFGRGGEEMFALAAAGVPFRVISGVTAGLAALAAASIPATLRGVNRAIIFAAGHGGENDAFDWAPLARTGQPIV